MGVESSLALSTQVAWDRQSCHATLGWKPVHYPVIAAMDQCLAMGMIYIYQIPYWYRYQLSW